MSMLADIANVLFIKILLIYLYNVWDNIRVFVVIRWHVNDIKKVSMIYFVKIVDLWGV